MLPLVDIHVHLLAGLDDGPRTLADALAMCRAAHGEGVRLMAATAHQNERWCSVTPDRIRRATEELSTALKEEGIAITVLPCAEVTAHPETGAAWRNGALLSMANRGEYLLLEMPHPRHVAARRNTSRLSLESLEGRLTPSTLVVDTNLSDGNYHTIQSAVTAAHPGDTIVVKPGTYTEQVTIGSGKNGLTLTTSGSPDATIHSPGFPVSNVAAIDSAYVVGIFGSSGVTIKDFNIKGSTSTPTFGTEYGIKVGNNASANITNNNVKNIVGPSFSGTGGGAGIVTGEFRIPTVGQATISNNSVSGYGAAGIVIDGAGSLGTVTNNYVKGLGSSAAPLSQNGIQVSFGANATVRGNSVTANTVVAGSAAGILVDQSGSSTAITGNWTYGNEYGIFVFASNAVTIASNNSLNNHNDGIQLQGTNNCTVANNISANNGGDGISVYGSVSNDPSSAANNVVAFNLISSNVGNGVTVEDTTGTQVVANIIVSNRGNGVSLTDALGGSTKFNFIDQDNGAAIAMSSNSTTKPAYNVIVF